MSSFRSDDIEKSVLVKKTILPAEIQEENLQTQQKKSTYSWVVRLWYSILGYASHDIARLKEAGVSLVESGSSLKAAEVQKTIAEAERIFADVEEKRHEFTKKKAEAELIQAKAFSIRIKAITDCMERLASSISRIRQEGGDVAFDASQLEKLIKAGCQEFPDDEDLSDAASQIADESEE